MKLFKSQCRYFKPFWDAKATTKNESNYFAHFDPKIGRHGNVPFAIGKKTVRSVIYDQIPTIR